MNAVPDLHVVAWVPTPAPSPARLPRRIVVSNWLRQAHGWIGLWGAALGLLFGISGIWLNHRSVLPLQVAQARSNTQLALPEPPPADAAALAAWLRPALELDAPATNVRVEPPRPVAWSEHPKKEPGALLQPEHWMISFGGPRETIQADYWVGNRSVGIRRTASGFVGTLTNLHKGIGMPLGWILLVDTLAGSLVLLSLSGLALWLLSRRRRTTGLAIFLGSLALTAGLAISRI
jgi:hypothetical protein